MNYDFSKWHSNCGEKQLITAGGALHIYCPTCQVVANVEAISAKISPADACKPGEFDRVNLGKQSANVNKGMVTL